MRWFRDKGIAFKTRRTAIKYGISIVRSYIKDGKGRSRFLVDEGCTKTIDGLKQYRYAERNGIILNENPVKEDDDAADMVRYLFVNFFDNQVDSRAPTAMPA